MSNNDLKITSVRTVTDVPVAPLSEPAPTTRISFSETQTKWAHKRDEVRSLPWSGVPGDMLRDFLAAAMGAFEEDYGHQAASKAGIALASIFISRGEGPHRISAQWPQTGAGIDLRVGTRPEQEPSPLGTVIEGHTAPGATEDDIRKELGDLKRVENRLVLDPVDQLPNDTLAGLVAQIEKVVGPSSNPKNEQDTLFAAACVLLLWHKAERTNSAELAFALSGVVDGDREVAPGKTVTIDMTCQTLDKAPQVAQEDRQAFSLRARPG